jgi:hypothetical protein
MTASSRALQFLSAALFLAILVGLVVRRRFNLSYAFVGYAVTVGFSMTTMAAWPARFHNWSFYVLTETTQDVMKFALALELSFLIFGAFPTAAKTVRGMLFLLTLGILIGAARLVSTTDPRFFVTLHPWVLDGTAVILSVVFGLALWYRIPLHPWHKAILTGLIPYLLVFTILMDFIRRLGLELTPQVNARVGVTNAWAYRVVLVYWVIAAWRPRRSPPGDPTTICRIQPWLLARTGGMW